MKLRFYFFSITSSRRCNHRFANPIYKGLFIASLLLFTAATCFAQPVVYTFNNPGTYIWTCPIGVTSATIECNGGGGGGGGALAGLNDTAGGGGGGGAYVIDTLTVTPYTDYIVVVGAGGSAVAGADGGDGGASWFNSTNTVLAVGGAGGTSGANGVGGFGAGGFGGDYSFCVPAANAQSGFNGLSAGSTTFITSGAGGGAGGVTGTGAAAVTGSQGGNGIAGKSPSGGGSGGLVGTVIASARGGAGGSGRVIITYISNPATPVAYIQAGKGFNANAFPNPANGKTTVRFNSEASDPYTLKVFNITGRELVNKEGKTEQGVNIIDLDMTGYAKGLYLLHLRSGGNSQLIKLIVE